MSKLIGETTCPHCNKDHQAEIDLSQIPKVRMPKMTEEKEDNSKITTELEAIKGMLKEKPKEPEEKKSTLKIPTHVKKYKCKSCGKLHENKEFEGKPKGQCDNCGAFFTNKSSGKCPYCKPGEIGELDDEAIEKMELYEDEEDEHDHE